MAERQIQYTGSYSSAFVAGMFGALMMTLLMALGVWMQLSPLSLEMLLGSLITGQVGAATWLLGFGWHLLNGGIFATVYALVFKTVGRSGAGVGAMLGVVHWIVAGVLLNVVEFVHPFLPVLAPGSGAFFWRTMGGMTLVGSLILHLVFGAIVGGMYRASYRGRRAGEKPMAEDYRRSA